MKKTFWLLSVGVLLMTGCSDNQKQIKPSSTPSLIKREETLTLGVKFKQAVYFQNRRKYNKAIEIYDSIINDYHEKEDKSILSSIYINKFECSLLINRAYREQDMNDFLRRFGNNERDMMAFEVLYILARAKGKSMDGKVEEWASKYRNYRLDGWTFVYIDDWINQIEHTQIRKRLNRYVSIFKKYL